MYRVSGTDSFFSLRKSGICKTKYTKNECIGIETFDTKTQAFPTLSLDHFEITVQKLLETAQL